MENMENSDRNSKKMKDDDITELRCLITNGEAGVIIGKKGANVKEIREKSRAFVSILSNTDQKIEERVMSLKGSPTGCCDAFKLIAELLLFARRQRDKEPDRKDLTMRLLVHKFFVGAIIGKGGVIIKEIIENSGCRMQLSTETLGQSTEKTVTFSGTPDSISMALGRVVTQMQENPLRPNTTSILYQPGPSFPEAPYYGTSPFGTSDPYGRSQQGFGGLGGGGFPGRIGFEQFSSLQGYNNGLGMSGLSGVSGGMGLTKTEKIVIPTVCAGSVIGKRGALISAIKAQTGTQINIKDAEPNAPDDRVVSITGSHNGIQAAIFLIKERVESYQPNGQTSY